MMFILKVMVICWGIFVVFTFILSLGLRLSEKKLCLNSCALGQVIMSEKIACLLLVKLRGVTSFFCRIS